MRHAFVLCLFVVVTCSCRDRTLLKPETSRISSVSTATKIGDIATPPGFYRTGEPAGSFAGWLRQLPLKKDRTVYLYNGRPKKNQSAGYVVLDLPIGNSDLQQCADAVMRLRAEYLFAEKKDTPVLFTDFEGNRYNWHEPGNRASFDRYLQKVFGMCGSASLEKQLQPVASFDRIAPGDVLIRGGFPGHAMLVADLLVNQKGEKLFLLVQGYMPAQDLHVVVNPLDPDRGPWYPVTTGNEIITPEWKFYKQQLRSW